MDGSVVFTRWRHCAPPPSTCFLGPTGVQIPNVITIGLAIFAQLMAERPHTLQWAALPPWKLPLPMGDMEPNLIHGSLTWVLNPNDISISSAVFAGLTSVTVLLPSVLWHCCLGGRKGIRPVKTEWWGTGVVIYLEQGANDLHMVQLIPLPPYHLLLQ